MNNNINNTKCWIGIDPGKKGAIAAVTETNEVYAINLDNFHDRLAFIMSFKDYNVRCIMLEEVHSVYGSSAKANFVFGLEVGKMKEFCSMTGLTSDTVTPKKWQKFLFKGQPVKKRSKSILKKDIANKVTSLYPDAVKLIYGKRGGLLDGFSDAIAIAHYTRFRYN